MIPSKSKRKVEAVVAKDAVKPVEVRDPKFLAELAEDLVKAGGEGAGQVLTESGPSIDIRGVISTQCPTIDAAIGRGGIPLGRLTILHGKEASGKTTLALHIVAEVQRMGGLVVYVDKEYKLDPTYASKIGVTLDRQFVLSQPEHLEQVFAVVEGAVKIAAKVREKTGQRVPVLVVIDSINAATPKVLNDAEHEDPAKVGAMAAAWSKSLPRIMRALSHEDVALLAISQVRQKIGVLYGSPDEIAGGNAPKFYASLILEVKRAGALKKGEELIGNLSEVNVRKNGIAMPFKRAEFEIIFGEGINYHSALLARAKDFGVIETSGAWYSFRDQRIGQGAANAVKMLRSDPELTGIIQGLVTKHERWGGGTGAVVEGTKAEGAIETTGTVVAEKEPAAAPAKRDSAARAEQLRQVNAERAAKKNKVKA